MKRTKGELLSNTKNVKNSKFVARNTLKIEYLDGTTAIRLHNTDVITTKDGKYILNSGGWRTRTTMDRIEAFSPARLYQRNRLWYFSDGNLFYDNCEINDSGNLVGRKKSVNKTESEAAKLKKKISKYVNLVNEDNLPFPDSGDCWYCLMRTEDGKTLGDATNNHDHLESHLKEGYLHGSILVNAMKEAGYENIQIGIHYHMKLTGNFKRALRRYLYKRLLKL